ncbi:MAG: response regulator [Archaeoglobus sp.]|nr:response regulator [Archaeoglobus sp.]
MKGSDRSNSRSHNRSDRRILLVDPDATILEILKVMLSDYDCVCTTDGESAIELYPKLKPTLVLTEIALPGMDGAELTRKILEMDVNAKIIGLTAFKSKWGEDLIEAGAIDVMDKPFKKDELLGIVEKYFGD